MRKLQYQSNTIQEHEAQKGEDISLSVVREDIRSVRDSECPEMVVSLFLIVCPVDSRAGVLGIHAARDVQRH